MDEKTKILIVKLYNGGFAIRKIKEEINSKYGYETIRKELKKAGVVLRGRGMVYKSHKEFTPEESLLFAELLGYLYGDGHLHKLKKSDHGIYDCAITFSSNEQDLIERVVFITESLFQYKPRIVRRGNFCTIKLRRSWGKYLAGLGYPIGKKSAINPNLPLCILKTNAMKRGFICGFFNAEASINKSVSVQQSVRIDLPEKTIQDLKKGGRAYCMNNKFVCYFISWSKAKNIVPVKDSNMLLDLKTMLSDLGIKTNIYPVRLYIGSKDQASIHFELRIFLRFIRRFKRLQLLSQKEKVNKLDVILQRWLKARR